MFQVNQVWLENFDKPRTHAKATFLNSKAKVISLRIRKVFVAFYFLFWIKLDSKTV